MRRGQKLYTKLLLVSLTGLILIGIRFSLDNDVIIKPDDTRESSASETKISQFDEESSHMTLRWGALRPAKVQVLGMRRTSRGFLTIGVPSVMRRNGNEYLMMTLQSLISMTSDQEKREVVIVVFLADFNPVFKSKTAKLIAEKYSQYLSSGFLQIVHISPDYYPRLDHLKRNFNDKPERVIWRSKQVADYAFLFMYSSNMSTYYLQLEDDVMSSKRFIEKIKAFISKQEDRWTILNFSELGFIGKLFRNGDLEKLSRFMLLFYEEQPVDWLIDYFSMTMAQKKRRSLIPTLFQHFGKNSSLKLKKVNNLNDRFFVG